MKPLSNLAPDSEPRHRSASLAAEAAWGELVMTAARQAQEKPWRLRLLSEQGAAFYLRFRAAYRRLQQLRPGQARRLFRRLGLGLAGAALLLPLGNASYAWVFG